MSRRPAFFFGLLILAGVLLVGLGFLRDSDIQGWSPEHPSPDPEWFVRATPKSDFLAHFKALDDTRTTPATLAMTAVAQLVEQMGGVSSLQIELQATRVLRSGHEYDTRPVVAYRRSGESFELSLEVTGAEGKPLAYWVELSGGSIARAGVRVLDDAGELSDRSMDLPMFDAQLPIDVGDLRLGDLFALSESLLGRPPVALGLIERPGSKELLVYGLVFHTAGVRQPAGTEDAPRDRSGRGASALIYVQADDYTLRTIRVFDSSERLVRVYGDFVFEQYGALPLPRMFTVTSIVTNSHTRFHIQALDIS